MNIDFDVMEFMGSFIEDMKELLKDMDMYILELENDMENKKIINDIFRVSHSMKGMAATIGFEKMAKLTHSMEDLLHDIREDKIKADKKLIDLLFVTHDYLYSSLEYIIQNSKENTADSNFNELIDKIHNIALKSNKEEKIQKKSSMELTEDMLQNIKNNKEKKINTYKIIVKFEKNCILKVVRTYMVIAELEKKGEIVVSEPDFEDIKKGETNIEFDNFQLIFTTKESKKNISEIIKSVSEVEEAIIENISDMKKLNEVKENNVEDERIKARIEVGEAALNLQKDFIDELNYLSNKNEEVIYNLKMEPENKKIIRSLYRNFHSIKGLGSLINFVFVEKIASKIEKLIEKINKNREIIDDKILTTLLNANDYINTICSDVRIISNKDFLESLEIHLKNIDELTDVEQREIDLDKKVIEINRKNEEEKDKKEENSKKEVKKIGDILVEQGILTEDEAEEIAIKQKAVMPDLKFGEIVVKEQKAEAKEIVNAINIQQKKTTESIGSYIKVNTNKIDNLVDAIGELIILKSQIEQDFITKENNQNKTYNKLLRMNRITKDIQNVAMALRMVSLQATFQKLNRVYRDTLKELDKEVDFEYFGENTDIDRDVAEKIIDPLMHMLKNSISHGIEKTPENRLEKGKSRRGNVVIGAYNKKGNVYIEIEDDGQGIIPEKIYKKAAEKNIIDLNKEYTDEEIVNFIFLPGFSTAENVNSISGRGVGMDVVKTEITKLGGKIDIENKPGYGCKFILKIPVNMAAMNGTIVDIGKEKYIIPTSYIKEIFKPEENNWISIKGIKNKIKLRETIIEVISLEKLFGIDKPEKCIIIILEIDEKLRALPVNNIIGHSEIVVKSIGEDLGNINYASGASILGNGKVSLILDIENIFKLECSK